MADFKIDMHIHSRERSSCSVSSEEDMIHAAIRVGLNGIVLTDHDRLISKRHLTKLNVTHAPFRVYGGIELTLPGEHVLVYGLHTPRLERRWSYPELYTFVKERGGFLVLAHPFRFHNHISFDVERYPPDAMEGFSYNTPVEARPEIRNLSQRLGIPLLSNSDAHNAQDIGIYYNRLARTPKGEDELIEALTTGAFTPVPP